MDACEVCGTAGAQAVLLTCTRCPIRCHSYCLPGPHVQHRNPPFLCIACCEPASPGPALTAPHSEPASPGPARTAPDWSQLPTEVLSCILQHIPLQHRLSSCAQVCIAWAAAAAGSVRSLSFKSETAGNSGAWWWPCAKFGKQLTSLRVKYEPSDKKSKYGNPITHLPCSALQDLELCSMPVQLAAYTARPRPGVLHALTALTRLCLQDVRLLGQDDSQHLTAAARLPSLQHLHMDVQVEGKLLQPVLTLDVLQLLQLLPLTYLHLQLDTFGNVPAQYFFRGCLPEGASRVLSTDAAQHIGRLTRLQHLALFSRDSSTEQVPLLGHATQLLQLTQLTYLGLGAVLNCQLPALSGLGALQCLELRGCRRLDWTALEGLSKLQRLQLVEDHTIDDANTAQLLSMLQHQTELTSLQVQLPYRAAAADITAAAYAALTASSKLRHLDLCHMILPEEAWQHILPGPGQRPQLTALTGCKVAAEIPAARASLLQACPDLQRLELYSQSGTFYSRDNKLQVSDLVQLSSITHLQLHNGHDDDIPALLQMPQLQHLDVPSGRISDAGIEQLTGLQQLTKLRVTSYNRTVRPHARVVTRKFVGPDDTDLKPVWAQLQEHCEALRQAEQDRPWRNRLRSRSSTAKEEGQPQQSQEGAAPYRTRLRTRSSTGPSQTAG